ncbi:hypothetical protein B0H66DRAFT_64341 [Apodospora peruviana]|uniref:Uncharacterized protein n=1 Tax=Apodospora peruviana TaxID=516989 RepID=A0AAE0ISI5_9PEZI|nr:hypothetical protein B0H66DRAFT_64341 [Apodospora peruviana]
MATNVAPPYAPAAIETIRPEDFETASIRSAAPSYTSDAPSYHSTVPTTEPVPPYSPPAAAPRSGAGAAGTSTTTLLSMDPPPPGPNSQQRQLGLPPVPDAPPRLSGGALSLGQFRIPTISANPNARHYHRVAHRRATAAASTSQAEGVRRVVLDQIEEEERNRVRPLEDPYLVGEQAAAQARRERLARENGDDILIREDRRWDWFLSEPDERPRGAREELETLPPGPGKRSVIRQAGVPHRSPRGSLNRRRPGRVKNPRVGFPLRRIVPFSNFSSDHLSTTFKNRPQLPPSDFLLFSVSFFFSTGTTVCNCMSRVHP